MINQARYTQTNCVLNLASILLFAYLLIMVIMIYSINKCLSKRFKRSETWCKKYGFLIFWTISFRFMIEIYMELCISVLLNFTHMEFNLSGVLAVVIFIAPISLLPIYI